jgi:BlaI family penicillinase repressor
MRLSEGEWQVMNALWECHPATAREIAEHLPAGVDWAYTTIKTMLTRLAAKKAVSERKRGNASVYEPLVTRAGARRSALAALLNQAFDGAAAPMVHFLVEDRKLSRKERRELRRILEEEDATKGGSR